MEHELDAVGMLDLKIEPCFCVKDNTIVHCNAAARSILVCEGTDVRTLVHSGAEEYAAFSGGTLYLTVLHSGTTWSACVTKHGEYRVFQLEQDRDQLELQTMALAAREIRGPLSGVMATADQLFPLRALDDDPALREQVARLNRGLYQILRVISNMSDAERYFTTAAHPEMLEIGGLFREIFSRAQDLVSHAGIELRFEPLAQQLYCPADRELLERAVLNILSNSLKFTPRGGCITAKLTRRDNRLALTVTDTGEGIPDALRGSLHNRYQRRSGIEDGRYGIGLGMVLIRSAAASHGGTVLIDHPEGMGTRITMTLAIRQDTGGTLRSPLLRIDYAGERDHSLIELSDSLPAALYDTK